MTLAHARALIKDPIVQEHTPAGDREAMLRLAEWCATRYAPIVSPDPCSLDAAAPTHPDFSPDGLVMDITGCARLFKGEARLAAHIGRSLARLGFSCRIGIAPSIGAAWAVARFPSPAALGGGGGGAPATPEGAFSNIFSHAQIRAALNPLPITALRIPPGPAEALIELGVERIEQLLALPRSALPSRFGPLLTLRIDQALGQAMETIEPVRPKPPLRIERRFDGPTPQVEAIERASQGLLDELSDELLRRESGVRTLEARFERLGSDARTTDTATERITLSRPTRSSRHLWSLLRPRIEKLHLGYGVEAIVLVAVRTARLRHRQTEYGEERHRGTDASRHQEADKLVDALTNRLGPERVLRAEPVESHVPERSWKCVPAIEEAGATARDPKDRAAVPASDSRPTTLFHPPEPAEAVALPDRPPSTLRWRGRDLAITAGIGPERIACEWWKQRRTPRGRAESWERDYFRIRDEDGRWLWVFRESPLAPPGPGGPVSTVPPRWFIHGLWS